MKDYYVKSAHRAIDELEKLINAAEAKAEKATFDFAGQKIQALEAYKMPHISFSVDHPDAAQKKADELYESDKQVRERNKAISESNKRIKDALVTLMKGLGFSETVRVHKSPRSSKMVTETAQWASYLNGIPTDVWASRIDSLYQEWCERINKKRQEATVKQEADKKKREADEKERTKLRLLVTLGLKYGADFHSVYDAIRHLLEKDKYLALAYYLEKNHGDWSDGCDYAETGLKMFAVENEDDKAIYEEISEICSDFEDGRSFRDCKWNYYILYGMADKELYADLDLLREYDNNW